MSFNTLCPFAVQFQKKLDEVIFAPLSRLGERGATRAQLAQAKYLLQEEYQSWKKSLPALHGRSLGSKHRCLSEVYDALYDSINIMDLQVRPVLNLILDYDSLTRPEMPPQAPAPQIDQIAGIFLGEQDE